MVAISTPGRSPHRWGVEPVVKIAVVGVLFLALNFWQVRELVNLWTNDSNWSHGFIIPLFSLYLLSARREELYRAERRICLWGIPILVLSILVMVAAFYPIQNRWIRNLSMTGMLFGLVLYLAGPRVAKLTWLPIFYLALAMPFPPRLYYGIAYPLQELAAVSSTFLLKLFGVLVYVTRSHLEITSITGKVHPLTVAEACSGVRSLMAFIALGVAMAYIEPRPMWQRITLVASTLPITVACNILRVTATAWAYVQDKPELGQDVMHTVMGMVLLIPALGMLLLLSWLLNSLFVDHEEPEDRDDAGTEARAAKP
jgi:exosortase